MIKKDILQIFAAGADGEAAAPSQEHTADTSDEAAVSKAAADKRASAEKKKGSDADTQPSDNKARSDNEDKAADPLSPLLEKIRGMYPEIDGDNTDELVKAFLGGLEETDKKQKNAADEEKKVSAVKTAEALIQRRARESLNRYLREESEKLKEIYPSFSLEDELQNSPEFRHLLQAGVSLRRAFETVNLEKIMGSALRYAVMSAGKKTAETIRNGRRVSENSLQDSASSVMHTDVNSLTGKDIMRILSEVSKGAKISF